MDTKRQVTVKFIAGVVLILISLVLGKLVLVPIVLFPGSNAWRTSMIIVYIFSWLLLLAGIALAGIEGFKLATHKYRQYQRKTIHTVKRQGRKAAHNTRKAARHTKNAAKHTVKTTVRVLKKTGRKRKPRM
jgi:hypothetical protein